MPVQERGHKALGRGNAIGHLISLEAVNIIGGTMLVSCLKTPTTAPAVNAIFGAIYALQSTKLIIDHMSKEPFNILIWPLVAMGLVTLNACFSVLPFNLFCWVMCGLVWSGYIGYVVQNINEICNYLEINCLTLRHLQKTAS